MALKRKGKLAMRSLLPKRFRPTTPDVSGAAEQSSPPVRAASASRIASTLSGLMCLRKPRKSAPPDRLEESIAPRRTFSALRHEEGAPSAPMKGMLIDLLHDDFETELTQTYAYGNVRRRLAELRKSSSGQAHGDYDASPNYSGDYSASPNQSYDPYRTDSEFEGWRAGVAQRAAEVDSDSPEGRRWIGMVREQAVVPDQGMASPVSIYGDDDAALARLRAEGLGYGGDDYQRPIHDGQSSTNINVADARAGGRFTPGSMSSSPHLVPRDYEGASRGAQTPACYGYGERDAQTPYYGNTGVNIWMSDAEDEIRLCRNKDVGPS